jgi:short-subunit dehydrogenase
MAVYYASKAFVLSFSEALSSELKGTGVTVTCLCPGPTFTGFQHRASTEKTRLFKKQFVMNSEDVAAAGYKALMKGKRLKIPGFLNKITVLAGKFSPRWAVIMTTKWFNT